MASNSGGGRRSATVVHVEPPAAGSHAAGDSAAMRVCGAMLTVCGIRFGPSSGSHSGRQVLRRRVHLAGVSLLLLCFTSAFVYLIVLTQVGEWQNAMSNGLLTGLLPALVGLFARLQLDGTHGRLAAALRSHGPARMSWLALAAAYGPWAAAAMLYATLRAKSLWHIAHYLQPADLPLFVAFTAGGVWFNAMLGSICVSLLTMFATARQLFQRVNERMAALLRRHADADNIGDKIEAPLLNGDAGADRGEAAAALERRIGALLAEHAALYATLGRLNLALRVPVLVIALFALPGMVLHLYNMIKALLHAELSHAFTMTYDGLAVLLASLHAAVIVPAFLHFEANRCHFILTQWRDALAMDARTKEQVQSYAHTLLLHNYGIQMGYFGTVTMPTTFTVASLILTYLTLTLKDLDRVPSAAATVTPPPQQVDITAAFAHYVLNETRARLAP